LISPRKPRARDPREFFSALLAGRGLDSRVIVPFTVMVRASFPSFIAFGGVYTPSGGGVGV
jgi:hypothetical protein